MDGADNNNVKLKSEFEAQVTAALMLQFNALIPTKVAVQICGISRKEIDRRVEAGTFPIPEKLSGDSKSIRKGFRAQDIKKWLDNPRRYES